MSQVKTRTVSAKKAMSSRAFRVGFEEVRAGKPFNPAYAIDDAKGSEWDYERGRQFATLYKGHYKSGNKVTMHALVAFSYAINNHYII